MTHPQGFDEFAVMLLDNEDHWLDLMEAALEQATDDSDWNVEQWSVRGGNTIILNAQIGNSESNYQELDWDELAEAVMDEVISEQDFPEDAHVNVRVLPDEDYGNEFPHIKVFVKRGEGENSTNTFRKVEDD